VLGPVRARLDETLLAQRAEAAAALQTTMASEWYLRLLDSVRLFVADPPLAPHAGRPAAKITKDVRRAQRKATRRLDIAIPGGSDEALHRARKSAKRARYAVEAAGPVLGKSAAATVERYKELQDGLGDHNDAVVAADLLLRLGRAAGAHHANGFTFGLLYQRQLDAAATSRAELPRLADAVRRKSSPG
jgi:CHAD domain-containing protein